jgi:hypothetical protein
MLAGGNPDGILGKVIPCRPRLLVSISTFKTPWAVCSSTSISPRKALTSITSGALKQMAALVAEGPGTERYCNARDKLAAAIVGFNEKAKAKGGKTIADVRMAVTLTARLPEGRLANGTQA